MNIQYICFTGSSGFSAAAMNYVAALEHVGHNVSVTSIDNPPTSWAKEKPHKPAKDALQIYHCIPEMFRRVKRRGKSIAIATFETMDPPKTWFHLLNKHTAVVVPSEFCKREFAPVKSPVHKIPHCLGDAWFEATPNPVGDIFKFLFVGAWKERKGWRVLLEAWSQAFTPDDPVRLVIKTDDINRAKAQIMTWQKRVHKAPIASIQFLGGRYSEQEIIDLYCDSQCVVVPSLGEGFGYSGLQGLVVGLPTILTNYAGHTEYATAMNCVLIPPEELQEIHFLDRVNQFRHRKWASPDPSFVRASMKNIFDTKGLLGAGEGQRALQERFSIDAVGRLWDELIISL